MFEADVYISCNHNALAGKWCDHGGVEINTMEHSNANPISVEFAKNIHPFVVKAIGIKDYGIKKVNFQILRDTSMPSVLMEGGFMDSVVDIIRLRDDNYLIAQGEAIVEGIAANFKLLSKTGYKIASDGSFGLETLSTVKAFQVANKLVVDGIVGPTTKESLANVVAPKNLVSPIQSNTAAIASLLDRSG